MRPMEKAVNNSGFYVTISTTRGATTKKVDGDLLSVGRSDDCNLSIAHDTLNRRHMSVSLRNGECWIEDHGSRNGTYVNGQRLKPHAPTRVRPDDFVQLAQSGVRLSVSTEPVMPREVAPPLPELSDPAEKNTIITTTASQRQEQRTLQLPAKTRTSAETQALAEELIQEAMKRSAKMVEEAQVDAERRVQEIYRRAHDTQIKTETAYQARLNEAYRTAESAFHKSQVEAQSILEAARSRSVEIRNQAENFVLELRQRSEEQCEQLLSEAQQTARELKESRLIEAEELIRKKEEQLMRHTREAMADRMARLEEELDKETVRHREMIDKEIKDRRQLLEVELKEQSEVVEKLKKEAKAVMELKAQEQSALAEVGQQIDSQRALAKSMDLEIGNSKKAVVEFNQQLCDLRTEIDKNEKERATIESSLKDCREKLKWMQEEIRTGENRVKMAQDDIQNQLAHVKEKFEQDRVQLAKDEQKRLEEMKLETTRQVQALEQQLLNEVYSKRDRLNREVILTVEKFLKEKPETKGIGLRRLEDDIGELLQEQIITMSQGKTAKSKQKSLVSLRRREKMRSIFMGVVLGAAIFWSGQQIYRVKFDPAPMQRKVAAAAEERKADLERRKFNPLQTKEFRTNYVDNVIYNEGFVATYASDAFQKAFFKDLAAYMFKTWRLEEDKSIQLLALSTTLVHELQERRENIHPDFIPQGIEKMKELETERLGKMRQLLGSQVRVESFRKFEHKFFESYRAKSP